MLTRGEIRAYLAGSDDTGLFARARQTLLDNRGRTVYLRGLLEFSSCCMRNCRYCGLRRGNARARRFRLTPAEVLETARHILDEGIRTVVLQSGDDPGYAAADICRIIGGIKDLDAQCAVTLSVGERPYADYRAFRAGGAERYLLRHEAADPGLYADLHPGRSAAGRQAILVLLKELGFQEGAGMMTGLPGQTVDHLTEDIMFLQAFRPAMTGIGPFLPHRETPLGQALPGDLLLTRRVLALARLAVPDALMPATTALATLDPDHGLRLGLEAGCDVIMLDYTPDTRREAYNLYDGKARVTRRAAEAAAEECGRILSGDRGDCVRSVVPL